MKASQQAVFSVEQPSPETVILGGEVDLSNARQVKAVLDGWLDQQLSSYVLDLRQVQRIDSSGLGLVVGAYRRAITQDSPKASFLLHAEGTVLRVIRLIGLDKVLPLATE
jgi:anti-anti-sigma factor